MNESVVFMQVTMSDSIIPNQRSKSSLMNNATRSESPNSIPTAVNFYGTMNFNNTVEAAALAVAEVIHQVLLIFLCLTLTGKCINVKDR